MSLLLMFKVNTKQKRAPLPKHSLILVNGHWNQNWICATLLITILLISASALTPPAAAPAPTGTWLESGLLCFDPQPVLIVFFFVCPETGHFHKHFHRGQAASGLGEDANNLTQEWNCTETMQDGIVAVPASLVAVESRNRGGNDSSPELESGVDSYNNRGVKKCSRHALMTVKSWSLLIVKLKRELINTVCLWHTPVQVLLCTHHITPTDPVHSLCSTIHSPDITHSARCHIRGWILPLS